MPQRSQPPITAAAYAGDFTGLLRRAQSEQRQKRLAWAMSFEQRRYTMVNAYQQYGTFRDAVANLDDTSAEGVKTKLRKLEAELRRKIECPICYEVMDPRISNKRHKGYVVYFNCGHAACTDCALKYKDRCENATCPLCRAPINGSLRDLQPPLPDADPQYCELSPTPRLLEEIAHDDDDAMTFQFPKAACYLCPNEFARGAVVKKHSSLTGKIVCVACADKPVPPCNRCARPCNHHDASGGTTLRNTVKTDDESPAAWSYTCGPCIRAQYEESGLKGLPSGATALLKKMGQKRDISGSTSSSSGCKRRRA